MKKLGVLLIVVGIFFLLRYYNMETTVTTEGKDFGYGISIPSVTVNNLGLMEDRRNGMTMSGMAILIGVILFVAGSMDEKKSNVVTAYTVSAPVTSTEPGSRTRKCPYCAEEIKAEAVLCRFCNRDLPSLEVEEKMAQKITELSPEQLGELKKNPELLAAHYGIEKEGALFKVQGKYFERFFDAVAHAEIKALKSKLGDIQGKIGS